MAENSSRGWLSKAALWVGEKVAALGGGMVLDTRDPRLGNFLGGGPSITGHNINDDSAMRITTAFACVRVLAETVGTVVLQVFERQDDGNAKKVDDHPLCDVLIDKPNQHMRGQEYREAKTTNLAARGNTYSLIERRGDGNVASLYPLPSREVTPKRKSDGEIVYSFNDRGKPETYPAEKIWHIRGFGWNGLVGLSPIECARQAMGLALAGEEANARLFANGMVSSAIIKIPQWLKEDQRKIAEAKIQSMHSGLVNHGKPYLLEGGMDVAEGIFAPKDAQFLELRKMQIPEICRLWRISPHMVADLERATNNNIEQLSLEFVMYTMLPYFRRFEERAADLFKPEERKRFFVRFNYESLLRADSQARANLYSILLQNGVYSRNEVRALENRNRVEGSGMDDYTVQTNMTPVDKLAAIVAAQTASKGQPGEKGAPLVVVEPTQVKVDLRLPEAVGIGQEGIARSVKDLGQELRRVQAIAESSAASLSKAMERFAEAQSTGLAEGFERVADVASMPRKVVKDAGGEPIGTVAVKQL